MIQDDVVRLLREVRPVPGAEPIQIVPATEEELNAFEQAHGPMPPELKWWFRTCNGAAVNPGGLESLFPKKGAGPVCLDWYFKQYPHWKAAGWFPIGGDGNGDLYILNAGITIPSTKTHPVCFLDQQDFSFLTYAMASGLWKFLYCLLKTEVVRGGGKDLLPWPFDKRTTLAIDPNLVECTAIPLPWEKDDFDSPLPN